MELLTTLQKDSRVSKVKYVIKLPEEEEQSSEPISEDAILQLSFVNPISSKLVCVLCRRLLRNPCHVTCCSSPYCRGCIDHLGATSARCASEKCRRSYAILAGKKEEELEQKIRQTKVYCPMRGSGCKWVGSVEDLETVHWTILQLNLKEHGSGSSASSKCQYQELECPNLCGLSLPLWFMEEHLSTKCEKEMVACEYCGEEDSAALIHSVHHLQCRSYPIMCPNQCGMPGISRHRIIYHVEEECPLRLVSCGYRHAGCITQVQACKLAEHETEFVSEHLKLMSEKMDKVARESRSLRKKNEVLARHIVHLVKTLQKASQLEYEEYVKMVSGGSLELGVVKEDLLGLSSVLIGRTRSQSDLEEKLQVNRLKHGSDEEDGIVSRRHQYARLLSPSNVPPPSYESLSKPVETFQVNIDEPLNLNLSEERLYDDIDNFLPEKMVAPNPSIPFSKLDGETAKEKLVGEYDNPLPRCKSGTSVKSAREYEHPVTSTETSGDTSQPPLPSKSISEGKEKPVDGSVREVKNGTSRPPLPSKSISKEKQKAVDGGVNGPYVQEKLRSSGVFEDKEQTANEYDVPTRPRSQTDASVLSCKMASKPFQENQAIFAIIEDKTKQLPVPALRPKKTKDIRPSVPEKPRTSQKKFKTLPSFQEKRKRIESDDAGKMTVGGNSDKGVMSDSTESGVYSVIMPQVMKQQDLKPTPTNVGQQTPSPEKEGSSKTPPAIKPKPTKTSVKQLKQSLSVTVGGDKPGERVPSPTYVRFSSSSSSSPSSSEPGSSVYNTLRRSTTVDQSASGKGIASRRSTVSDSDFLSKLNAKLENNKV